MDVDHESTSWMEQRPAFTFDCLRQERASLPAEEKCSIARDRFGLNTDITEDPDFVARKLREMERALDSIDDEKEAYETALFINPTHVESESFRLAFLRTDKFDATAAARRMIRYWQRKVDLFGVEKAFQPSVTILHFRMEDYPALVKGAFRLLPTKDDRGRAIIFHYMAYYGSNATPETMIRLMWYIVHAAIFGDDDDSNSQDADAAQRNGIVALAGNGRPGYDQLPFSSLNKVKNYFGAISHDATNVLPVRMVASHSFPTHAWALKFSEHFLYCFAPSLRARFNLHDVSNIQQSLLELSRCGISPGIVPFELGGNLKVDHIDWLYERLFSDVYLATGLDPGSDEWESIVPQELRELLSS
mmetsp:Transcript_14002/g.15381  ORF Transcript_14002/g.15381 Transcript_14002/m.15381 type:complete len:361 (+) Transcript_14002:84-1166(+)|eukprot:CAMPEP_0195304068 /NCGR_PEP_ID=MMETSP0707-20130614/33796_1 /TAXON_ID=33640 /ORGANISM="Asterionellopsis glacialis, Strain CCMP134" /LENGTH=360 /DNA_ID=CAMNT_0040367777 /DNA_START=165 /DNA_END=1247 /DNA_ORIENTATION=-